MHGVRAPPNEAPDLMHLGTGYGGSYTQCYFKKQPETPSEIEQACRAAGSIPWRRSSDT